MWGVRVCGVGLRGRAEKLAMSRRHVYGELTLCDRAGTYLAFCCVDDVEAPVFSVSFVAYPAAGVSGLLLLEFGDARVVPSLFTRE